MERDPRKIEALKKIRHLPKEQQTLVLQTVALRKARERLLEKLNPEQRQMLEAMHKNRED